MTAVFGLGGIKPEIGFTVAVLDHIIKKFNYFNRRRSSPLRTRTQVERSALY
ncbi:hypothetical protein [Methanosarcina barkeri]|uniref:hypothetical protein n=1 Tax=Methanosarcina barkeri TaxID=2208 RepID=UPI0024372E48|nr:hypothetical protein [Methanosarcina barkeri]